ncbi:endonuclease/exonuclease/phosphatase family protein [Microbacterium sediminicola]|uniref:Endonuclease/exonuclease/phosphatase family protein n=1 Tax=Microbacterium sediminicola TaxID=415210 RepID=A0ABP4TNW0_9MICO
MIRAVGVLIALLWAIAVAVLTFPDFFRVERVAPIAQIIAFRGAIVLVLAAVAAVSLIALLARPVRTFAAAILLVSLAGALVTGSTLAQRGLGAASLPAKTETSVRVLTWNTAGEATSAEEIAQLAVAMAADIVSLPETTIETGEAVAIAMREMGHPMWAHHTDYGGWDAGSTTLLIAPELGDYAVIASSQDGSSNTSTVPSAVAMPTSGSGPIVVAAHAVAPREGYMADWRSDLQWLADQCAADSVILVGDFNATVDHFGGLGVDGGDLGRCTDAASVSGNGAVGTWSTSLPALLGAPIDHVLVTPAWRVSGSLVVTSLDDVGSDHRPLVVQLEPAS